MTRLNNSWDTLTCCVLIARELSLDIVSKRVKAKFNELCEPETLICLARDTE